jgi:hypothetical protein
MSDFWKGFILGWWCLAALICVVLVFVNLRRP